MAFMAITLSWVRFKKKSEYKRIRLFVAEDKQNNHYKH